MASQGEIQPAPTVGGGASSDRERASSSRPAAPPEPQAPKKPSNNAMVSGGAVLLLLHAAMGVTLLYNPDIVMKASPTPCSVKDACMLLVRLNGLFQFVLVAMIWSILDAISKNHLASATYGRLMLGLVIWGCGQLTALHLGADSVRAPDSTFMGAVTLASGLSIVYGLGMYHSHQEGGLLSAIRPLAFLKMLVPRGVISAGYASIAVVSAVAAVRLLGMAEEAQEELFPPSFHNSFIRLMLRQSGASFLAVIPSACALKDAYERKRIWASTFQNLNFGLAVLYGGISWIMGIATSADLINITLLTQGIMWSATFAGFMAAYEYMSEADPSTKDKAQEPRMEAVKKRE